MPLSDGFCLTEFSALANLHNTIQIVFGEEDEHLHLFHIYGKDYRIAYAGDLSFSDNPYTVPLDDFDFNVDRGR